MSCFRLALSTLYEIPCIISRSSGPIFIVTCNVGGHTSLVGDLQCMLSKDIRLVAVDTTIKPSTTFFLIRDISKPYATFSTCMPIKLIKKGAKVILTSNKGTIAIVFDKAYSFSIFVGAKNEKKLLNLIKSLTSN